MSAQLRHTLPRTTQNHPQSLRTAQNSPESPRIPKIRVPGDDGTRRPSTRSRRAPRQLGSWAAR
eukprot:1686063-Rhodomonas_salina.1